MTVTRGAGTVSVSGSDGFLAAVRAVGLGTKRVDEPGAADALLAMGRAVVDGCNGGIGTEEMAAGIFDTPARPTLGQARAFVAAAVEHLRETADPVMVVPRSRPQVAVVSPMQAMAREALNATRGTT